MLGTPVKLLTDAHLGAYLAPSGDAGAWADALPERGRAWAPAIEAAATAAGVDPGLLAALVWQESGFVPDAISRSGAIGLTQLMPATAAGLGVDPHDPMQNLDGGARYLAWTLQEFGSLELGLAAYNAGPGNVRRAGLQIPDIPETQAYVPKVIGYYRRLGGHA
jgi:soluble lytic murein transglycosylase-like protein